MIGKSFFFSLCQSSQKLGSVILTDGFKTPIEGKRDIQATLTLSLSSVLYVPKLPMNLLSFC